MWTNRPVWPQGKAVADWVKGHPNGDPIRKGLNWDAWLATAQDRPFLDQYPKDAPVYDPWKLGKNVYHTFTWRGFYDFGAGAFGDMACHTMNLPFRGLELAGVKSAECIQIEEKNDVAYPIKSIVKLIYKARTGRNAACAAASRTRGGQFGAPSRGPGQLGAPSRRALRNCSAIHLLAPLRWHLFCLP